MACATFEERSPEDLLGPLNEVERRHAPAMLYVTGRTELLRRRPRVAVVGSRSASESGVRLSADIASAIVDRRGVVVSGLAKGVDAASHRHALHRGGLTVAVIGTPLDQCYPAENRALQEQIAEQGLLVTEFPLGRSVTRKDFVLRNRTMALVSHATVIVEASESSGTQHQGWEALRLGRVLFLPERLVDAPFEWPKKMIRYGALPFRDTEELGAYLDEYLPSPLPRPKERSGPPR